MCMLTEGCQASYQVSSSVYLVVSVKGLPTLIWHTATGIRLVYVCYCQCRVRIGSNAVLYVWVGFLCDCTSESPQSCSDPLRCLVIMSGSVAGLIQPLERFIIQVHHCSRALQPTLSKIHKNHKQVKGSKFKFIHEKKKDKNIYKPAPFDGSIKEKFLCDL